MFLLTLTRVLTMMAYAVPGFIFIRTKTVKPEAIPAFAKLLAYVCGPCLTFYSFSRATYSPELNQTIWICFGTVIVVMLLFLLLWRVILRKKFQDIRWRIFTIATTMGNVGFFGVPLLERLLSDYPNAFLFSEVMSISMNLLTWTYGMYIMSLDKKYMRPQKILTVPNFLVMLIAYPMFLNGWSFPEQVSEVVIQLGRMSTPLCMIILGMRLATSNLKQLFTDWRSLLASLTKLLIFPLLILGATALLPIEPYVRAALFLLGCCPCASMILNLSEILGQGQKSAANCALIATLLSIITLPVMVLLFFPM